MTPTPKTTPRPRRATASRPPLRLLLVEDNPADAKLVQIHLQGGSMDYEVHHATSLQQGLQLASAAPGITLLDLDLPDSKGLDTVKAWRAANPALPVVVLTGRRDRNIGLNALALGIHGFLAKDDATTERLEHGIRDAVERAQQSKGFAGATGGGLVLRRRDARALGGVTAYADGDAAIVYVTLREEPDEVRRALHARGVPPSRLTLLALGGPRDAPRADLGTVRVAGPRALEDLTVAVELGCARMGRDCRVIIDDLEALAAGHAFDRCVEFLRTLDQRLRSLGVAAEVLVGKGSDGRALEARVAAELEA